MLNLEPIKQRLAEATPGPWAASSPWGELRVVSAPNGPVSTANDAGGFNNADFIAAAPEDMAALVAEVERLRSEMENDCETLEFAKDEMRSYIRKSQVLEAQVNAWRKALEWYASPAHWVEQVDDRGRETIRWRWADDDGRMARHALDSWKQNKKEKANGTSQGGAQETGGQGDQADASAAAPPGCGEAGEAV